METNANRRPKMTAKARRAACKHPTTIVLLDGAAVCICCEAVLK